MYKLGIDVGGTNTDAVLIDGDLNVISEVKHPTSANVFDGIMGAVHELLEKTQIDRSQIHQAMLGTTQCTNAIVERKPGQDRPVAHWRSRYYRRAAYGRLGGRYTVHLRKERSHRRRI